MSELVTNAVMHGAEPIRLGVAIDALVRMEVFHGDGRIDQVTPRHVEPHVPGNRGLQIVSALSHAWGAKAYDDGKIVWAELRFPD